MIPLKLSLSGFLSYRDLVEIDFTGFELACISGPNGAGKSSLLDAITWALFGQARKRDDSIINNQSDAAEVTLTFAYEGNRYRVQRTNPRGKTTILEFHICQDEGSDWKPLTERTLRETQALIEQTLRLDYETFVNASFFLQEKADQFTQQRPGDRKRILGSILGLEVWEVYRQRSAARRREVEADIDGLDGRLAEINAELAEEQSRKSRLEELEGELERLSQARGAQESALESARKVSATLAEQRKLVDTLFRGLEASTRALDELQHRLTSRVEERQSYAEILARAAEIEASHTAWQAARTELARWDEVAARFQEHEKRRQEPLTEIEAERARLEQELRMLQEQLSALEKQRATVDTLTVEIGETDQLIAQAETQLNQREQLEAELGTARQRQADAQAENPLLKKQMDDLKERIDQLEELESPNCPFCGQPLSPDERQRIIVELKAEGTAMGDRFRANQALLRDSTKVVAELEAQIATLSQAAAALRVHTQNRAQLSAQLEQIHKQRQEWEQAGAPRLAEIAKKLDEETFALEARARLAQVDAELKEIGYDAAAHDLARRAEAEGRPAEEAFRALEKAQSALAPLGREIADLEAQFARDQTELARKQKEHDEAAAALAAAEAQAPDVYAAERDLLTLQEQENRLRLDVGAAQQKVLVLDDLKARSKVLVAQREGYAQEVSLYRQLERAFGKDGVPALLIEQALPQIEAKANEVLDRLSHGDMSVRFVTQAAYKDRRREDLKETLDIHISDSAGTRDYEMYSGGEAFRVNFAIRLALSEVLAQRAGARLQTLVIDEGFGSQDLQGRQRLIEAINLVRQDFAKILVITHIDELKDAFPNRIEVEKTESGSRVQVI